MSHTKRHTIMGNNTNTDIGKAEDDAEDGDDVVYKSTELSWSSEDECSLEELFGKEKSTTSTTTPKSKKLTPSSSSKGTADSGIAPRRSTRRSSLKAAAAITAISGHTNTSQPVQPKNKDEDDDEDEKPLADFNKTGDDVKKEEEPKDESSRTLELEDRSADVEKEDEESAKDQSLHTLDTSNPSKEQQEVIKVDCDTKNLTQSDTRDPADGDTESPTQQSNKQEKELSPEKSTSLSQQNDKLDDDDAILKTPIISNKVKTEDEVTKLKVKTAPVVALDVMLLSETEDDKAHNTQEEEKEEAPGDQTLALRESLEAAQHDHDQSTDDTKAAIDLTTSDETPKPNETTTTITTTTTTKNAEERSEIDSNHPEAETNKAAEEDLNQNPEDIALAEDTDTTSHVDAAKILVDYINDPREQVTPSSPTENPNHDEVKTDSSPTEEAGLTADVACLNEEEQQPEQLVKDALPIMDLDEIVPDAMQVGDEFQLQEEPLAKNDDPQPTVKAMATTSDVYDLVTSESEAELETTLDAPKPAEGAPSSSSSKSSKANVDQAPTPIVMEESEDDEEVFAAFTCKRKRPVVSSMSKQSLKHTKAKKIKIVMESIPTTAMDIDTSVDFDDSMDPMVDNVETDQTASIFTYTDEYDGWVDDDELMESAMAFFGETHEDQDPSYVQFIKEQEERAIKEELAKLDAEDRAGRKAIEELVNAQLKEKQEATERNLERYRAKAAEDEQRDLQRLQERYSESTAANQSKIQNGLKIIQHTHNQEIQKALQQHHQNVSQRRIPEQIGSSEWGVTLQQLQAKQQRQMQEFHVKSEDMKKKCDAEFKREQEKIRQQREKRSRDIDTGRQKMFSKLLGSFQQLRQRYVKRHMQKMIKKKEEIMRKVAKASDRKETVLPAARDAVQDAMEATLELRPPSPIKSIPTWAEDSAYPVTGAAARHKHRKGVLGQINKQLSVELHNEGIWIYSKIPEEKSEAEKADIAKKGTGEEVDGNSPKRDDEFIPWGLKARAILQSVICGEIPIGYGADRFNLGDIVATQGGHIRCVVTDLRTSEETASNQRATAIREQEEASLADLERKSSKLSTLSMESEKNAVRADSDVKECMSAVEAAGKDVEKARKTLQDLQTKCRDYISPGKKQLSTLLFSILGAMFTFLT